MSVPSYVPLFTGRTQEITLTLDFHISYEQNIAVSLLPVLSYEIGRKQREGSERKGEVFRDHSSTECQVPSGPFGAVLSTSLVV